MRIGPRLEATRHLLGELALTLARQPRHHFPKQGRGPTTDLGCRRCEPLLALSSKPTKILARSHTQRVLHKPSEFRTTASHPATTEMAGKSLKSPWPLIRQVHEERLGPRID